MKQQTSDKNVEQEDERRCQIMWGSWQMGRDQATSRALAVWVAFCITQALLIICNICIYGMFLCLKKYRK